MLDAFNYLPGSFKWDFKVVGNDLICIILDFLLIMTTISVLST